MTVPRSGAVVWMGRPTSQAVLPFPRSSFCWSGVRPCFSCHSFLSEEVGKPVAAVPTHGLACSWKWRSCAVLGDRGQAAELLALGGVRRSCPLSLRWTQPSCGSSPALSTILLCVPRWDSGGFLDRLCLMVSKVPCARDQRHLEMCQPQDWGCVLHLTHLLG